MKLGNVLIIGDSYSTFEGYIPEGYKSWYSEDDKGRTDVREADKTWWRQLISRADCTLVHNESYSGTTVCNTERPSMPGTSFIYRTRRLAERGFFRENNIDTVFIFGGTNDSWIDSPIGADKYGEHTEEDLLSILPAYSYLVRLVRENAPEARIVSIVNCDIKPEVREGIMRAAAHFGIECIPLFDISKQNGHPDQKGMSRICDQVMRGLLQGEEK